MRVKYQCPACWEEVLAPHYWQGQSGPCPKCEVEIDTWPAPLNGRPRPSAAPAASPSKWDWWRRQSRALRVAIGLSAAVLLLGCPIAIAYFATRDRGHTGPAVTDAEFASSWSSGPVTVEATEATIVGDASLHVLVTIRTSDNHQRVNFTGWRRSGANLVKLRDAAGNSSAQRAFDPVADGAAETAWNNRPEAQALKFGPGPVTPEQGRVEILVFPKPPATSDHVDLDLAARALGLNGVVRLRLPSAMWRGSEPNPPAKPPDPKAKQ